MTSHTEISKRIDHLFRHESGKLTAVLTRIFGTNNIQLAEDVVQDTLLEALKVWEFKGVPENPVGWLYTVAKNKSLNIINREKYKNKFVSEESNFLKSEWTVTPALEHLFSNQEIIDDQLRMIFTCCHPMLTPDSPVALQ